MVSTVLGPNNLLHLFTNLYPFQINQTNTKAVSLNVINSFIFEKASIYKWMGSTVSDPKDFFLGLHLFSNLYPFLIN